MDGVCTDRLLSWNLEHHTKTENLEIFYVIARFDYKKNYMDISNKKIIIGLLVNSLFFICKVPCSSLLINLKLKAKTKKMILTGFQLGFGMEALQTNSSKKTCVLSVVSKGVFGS